MEEHEGDNGNGRRHFEELRLGLARRRAAGEDFDRAWLAETGRHAGESDARPSPSAPVLAATLAAWRRAYLREPPTAAETAAAGLEDAAELIEGRYPVSTLFPSGVEPLVPKFERAGAASTPEPSEAP